MDGDGYLFIANRRKRIFKHFGACVVCLSEIEDVLLKLRDNKSVCAVVHVPTVVVVRANGAAITEDDINSNLLTATII